MKRKPIKLTPFISYLLVACMYPIYAYVSAQTNPLLPCLDAMTIEGFVFIVIGVVYNLIRHGDFDILEYVGKRSLNKGDIKPFQAFQEDKQEKREEAFNYPLFTGLILLVVSALLAVFVY